MKNNVNTTTPKPLFIIASILTLLLGTVFVFFPKQMLVSWGTQPDPLAIYMARRYGVMFFGYAPILWLIRNIPASSTRIAILIGLTISAASMSIISTIGVLSGVVSGSSSFAILVEAFLTAGSLYFLLVDLRQRKPSRHLHPTPAVRKTN